MTKEKSGLYEMPVYLMRSFDGAEYDSAEQGIADHLMWG
jgi:hypothetical protein